jgi:hypothetical protein
VKLALLLPLPCAVKKKKKANPSLRYSQDANSAKWKDVEDIHKLEDKFHADGSLAADDFDKGHIELRALLEEVSDE